MFQDRVEAGQKLAEKLQDYEGKEGVVILGLPRGGVILANEVAKKLNAKLDIVVPRKIGAPGNEEFAIGAIAEDGEAFLNESIIKAYKIPQEYIDKEIEKEKKEAQRRMEKYRGERKKIPLDNKTVILVDDGIATGSTMLAAISSVRTQHPKEIIVAVPVLPKDTISKIEEKVDKLIYLDAPWFFGAVGAFYEDFRQTEDDEVVEVMRSLN